MKKDSEELVESWVLKLESILTVASAVVAFVLTGARATPDTYGI